MLSPLTESQPSGDHGSRLSPVGSLVARKLLFVLAGFALTAGAQTPRQAIPEPFPSSRYERIWNNSPFELDAPPPTSGAPQRSFAEHLTLVGITEVKGKAIVTVLDKKTGQSFDVREDGASGPTAIQLIGIEEGADPLGTRVQITQNGEVATLGFEVNLLASAPRQPNRSAIAPSAGSGSPLNRSTQQPNIAPVKRSRVIVGKSQQDAPPAGQPGASSAQPRTPPTQAQRRKIVIPK